MQARLVATVVLPLPPLIPPIVTIMESPWSEVVEVVGEMLEVVGWDQVKVTITLM